MKKWFFLMVLAAFWISARVPFEKTDVAKLVPVSTLVIGQKDSGIYVISDQGDTGKGETLGEALEDMEQTCPGRIFLDTVEYLLLDPGIVSVEIELDDYFRPGAYVCIYNGKIDPVAAADYLSNRELKTTVAYYEMKETDLPVLQEQDGSYSLNGEKS